MSTITEITQLFQHNNISDLSTSLLSNLREKYKRGYIVLDSKYRDTSQDNLTTIDKFIFHYASTRNRQSTFINSSHNIENIRYIHLYELRVPYVEQYMKTTSNRITLTIEEWSSQSFIERGVHFHYILEPVLVLISPNTIDLITKNYADGTFIPNQRITSLESISLGFNADNTNNQNTVERIKFPHDRDTCTFTYGNPTVITTTRTHDFLSAYTYITISNFTTDDQITDQKIILEVNSLEEIQATVLSSTQLSIPINTSSITPNVGLISNVFYEERRIIFNMEIGHE